MENVFELQLFADENAEEETVEIPADDQPEEPKEEPAKEPTEEKQEIPEELDGLNLSPEEVKDILKEAHIEEKPDADADSDNKQVQANDDAPKQNIPYERFKAVLDKQHAADEEIANLKRQLAEAQTKATTPLAPPAAPQPAPQPRPQAQAFQTFTPEIAKQIDEAANKQAMQITGMTKEDIDALEYADDSDAKAKTYRYAKDLARANIIENIQQSARRQQEYAAKILENHAKLVNEYNSYYQEQQAQPDYQDVVQFATNEFFEKQTPGTQFTVLDAYNRVQRNIASPQDILVVKNYFEKAQGAFRARSVPEPQKQMQNAKPSMPRAQEVAGSAASPKETVSIATLSKMLEENRFEDLPKKYQDILLGM